MANKPTVLDGMFKMLDTDHDNKISKEEFTTYYRSNEEFIEHKKRQAEEEHEIAQQHEDEEEGGNMLEWPKDADIQGKIMFCLAFPLVLIFCLTIPDVRKEGKFLGIRIKIISFTAFLHRLAWLEYCLTSWCGSQ